jgi:hypothetical protein
LQAIGKLNRGSLEDLEAGAPEAVAWIGSSRSDPTPMLRKRALPSHPSGLTILDNGDALLPVSLWAADATVAERKLNDALSKVIPTSLQKKLNANVERAQQVVSSTPEEAQGTPPPIADEPDRSKPSWSLAEGHLIDVVYDSDRQWYAATVSTVGGVCGIGSSFEATLVDFGMRTKTELWHWKVRERFGLGDAVVASTSGKAFLVPELEGVDNSTQSYNEAVAASPDIAHGLASGILSVFTVMDATEDGTYLLLPIGKHPQGDAAACIRVPPSAICAAAVANQIIAAVEAAQARITAANQLTMNWANALRKDKPAPAASIVNGAPSVSTAANKVLSARTAASVPGPAAAPEIETVSAGKSNTQKDGPSPKHAAVQSMPKGKAPKAPKGIEVVIADALSRMLAFPAPEATVRDAYRLSLESAPPLLASLLLVANKEEIKGMEKDTKSPWIHLLDVVVDPKQALVVAQLPPVFIPGHEYEVRVAAVNRHGASDWSASVNVFSPAGIPPCAPAVRPGGSQSGFPEIEVCAPLDCGGDAVNVWLVESAAADSDTTETSDGSPARAVFSRLFVGAMTPSSESADSFMFRPSGLQQGRKYYMRVAAGNAFGFGPFSRPILFNSAPKNPSTPTAVVAQCIDASEAAQITITEALQSAEAVASILRKEARKRSESKAGNKKEKDNEISIVLAPIFASTFLRPAALCRCVVRASWGPVKDDGGSSITEYEVRAFAKLPAEPTSRSEAFSTGAMVMPIAASANLVSLALSSLASASSEDDVMLARLAPPHAILGEAIDETSTSMATLAGNGSTIYRGRSSHLCIGAVPPSAIIVVQVRARNETGWSAWTAGVTLQVPTDIPEGVPAPVLLSSATVPSANGIAGPHTFRVGFRKPQPPAQTLCQRLLASSPSVDSTTLLGGSVSAELAAASMVGSGSVAGFDVQRVRLDTLGDIMQHVKLPSLPVGQPPRRLFGADGEHILSLLQSSRYAAMLAKAMSTVRLGPEVAISTSTYDALLSSDSQANASSALSSSQGVKISKLPPGSAVAIRVSADNDAGAGEFGPWSIFQVPGRSDELAVSNTEPSHSGKEKAGKAGKKAPSVSALLPADFAGADFLDCAIDSAASPRAVASGGTIAGAPGFGFSKKRKGKQDEEIDQEKECDDDSFAALRGDLKDNKKVLLQKMKKKGDRNKPPSLTASLLACIAAVDEWLANAIGPWAPGALRIIFVLTIIAIAGFFFVRPLVPSDTTAELKRREAKLTPSSASPTSSGDNAASLNSGRGSAVGGRSDLDASGMGHAGGGRTGF